jgi:hypothetical protein
VTYGEASHANLCGATAARPSDLKQPVVWWLVAAQCLARLLEVAPVTEGCLAWLLENLVWETHSWANQNISETQYKRHTIHTWHIITMLMTYEIIYKVYRPQVYRAQIHSTTSMTHEEVRNIEVLHIQAKFRNKSTTGYVRPLLPLGPLLWHDVTTLEARIPPLASMWRWCGLSCRQSIL